MAIFDDVITENTSWYNAFQGYTGNPPTTQEEYDLVKASMFSGTPPLWSDIETAMVNKEVINTRINLYGSTAEQLEYIVENGVDAFIEKQNQIKSDNTKI
jgi:hypothetical protein